MVAFLAVSAVACQNATAPDPQAQAYLEGLLPKESAYITGTVIERGNRLGQDSSVLVATNRRNPLADPCTARASRLPACGPPELTSVYGSHILHL